MHDLCKPYGLIIPGFFFLRRRWLKQLTQSRLTVCKDQTNHFLYAPSVTLRTPWHQNHHVLCRVMQCFSTRSCHNYESRSLALLEHRLKPRFGVRIHSYLKYGRGSCILAVVCDELFTLGWLITFCFIKVFFGEIFFYRHVMWRWYQCSKEMQNIGLCMRGNYRLD